MDQLSWHIEKRKVSELKGWHKNPRIITEEAFNRLKQRITERGFHDVIKIDLDNTVLSGNQRKVALLQLGVAEVDCIIPNRALTEKERDAIAIESNRNDGQWEMDLLAGFDMDLLKSQGFEDKELSKLFQLNVKKEEDPPAEPAQTSDTRVKLGDVWLLGRHRLMCGDATDSANVSQLVAGQKANMVFTDPPYNVDYTGGTPEELKIQNDKMEDSKFLEFLSAAFKNMAENLLRGGASYICHADTEGLNFRRAFIASGFVLKQVIIWQKGHFVLGRQDYQWKHEPILYGWLDGAPHNFYGDRNETTVWEFKKPNSSLEHPTMKPVDLVVKAINNSSKIDDIILDLFGGSGTTLIAAEQTGRSCLIMELDPHYCDVILNRWEKLTGQIAQKQNG